MIDEIALSAALAELNKLTGLQSVKSEIARLVAFQKINLLRIEMGLPGTETSLHLSLEGNAGVGKTTVARLIGAIYKALGLLPSDRLVEVSRADLVATFMGQTEAKTKEVIARASGAILFIDECYTLVKKDSSNDYGIDALLTIMLEMENRKGEFAVIVAGYPDLMETFFGANLGLASRFPRRIVFPNYSAEELQTIIQTLFCDACYVVTEEAFHAIGAEITEGIKNARKDFGNARWAGNLFNRIKDSQSMRQAFAANRPTKAQITRIVVADVAPNSELCGTDENPSDEKEQEYLRELERLVELHKQNHKEDVKPEPAPVAIPEAPAMAMAREMTLEEVYSDIESRIEQGLLDHAFGNPLHVKQTYAFQKMMGKRSQYLENIRIIEAAKGR